MRCSSEVQIHSDHAIDDGNEGNQSRRRARIPGREKELPMT